ncbi:MAG: DNA repair protein RecO [Patescibacteria group bacterium]
MGAYATEGIVLKHSPWREADRTIVVYTRDRGKISVVARSARKILSKLAGSVEPVTLVQMSAVRGKRNDTLTGAEVLYSFPALRRSVPAMAMAMLIGEVIDRSTFTSQHDAGVFALLDRSMRELESASTQKRADLVVIAWRFVWQFLAAVGYHPELYNCVECHEKIRQEKNWFDYQKGGVVCKRCGQPSPDRIAVSPDMVKIIRWLVATPSTPARLRIPVTLIQSAGSLTNAYLNYTHEHDLDFRPFLKMA